MALTPAGAALAAGAGADERRSAFLSVALYEHLHRQFPSPALPASADIQEALCAAGTRRHAARRLAAVYLRSARGAGIYVAAEPTRADADTPPLPLHRSPYATLAQAVAVTAAVAAGHRTRTAADAAAGLGATSTRNAHLLAAAAFGLLEDPTGEALTLTPLGAEIAANPTPALQRAAFLNVALYRRIVDRFAPAPLPTLDAVSSLLVAAGATPSKARRIAATFRRSALTAGLYPPPLQPGTTATAPPPLPGSDIARRGSVPRVPLWRAADLASAVAAGHLTRSAATDATPGGRPLAVAAAGIAFGLVVPESAGRLALTPLGAAVAAERTTEHLGEAFLTPPLFAQIHKRCPGPALPTRSTVRSILIAAGAPHRVAGAITSVFLQSALSAGAYPDAPVIPTPARVPPSLHDAPPATALDRAVDVARSVAGGLTSRAAAAAAVGLTAAAATRGGVFAAAASFGLALPDHRGGLALTGLGAEIAAADTPEALRRAFFNAPCTGASTRSSPRLTYLTVLRSATPSPPPAGPPALSAARRQRSGAPAYTPASTTPRRRPPRRTGQRRPTPSTAP